ncbi:glycosyltransferase family 2 protein [Prosthecomicrobium sp. N25]|uniref:glycosyltransferase family 2 protein n=1 Tax=Prosthecomicrobium sp. N25 TaxID=3129254 RepID=UPI0030781549
MPPVVTLIVCTRNRAERLRTTLEHVGAIRSAVRWDLIVVDNGSTDGTAAVVEAFAARHPGVPTRLVPCEAPGNGAGRNAGARQADGEVLSFVDDDCYVQPDHVDEVRRLFADPDLHFAGGRIVLHDPTDAPLTINESSVPVRVPPGGWVIPSLVQGANLMVRRRSFLAVGGFDPMFGAGAAFTGEDADLCNRLNCRGFGGGYLAAPTVRHHHGRKPDGIGRHKRLYARGYGALLAKHLVFAGHSAIAARAMLRHARWLWAEGEAASLLPLLGGFASYCAAALRPGARTAAVAEARP